MWLETVIGTCHDAQKPAFSLFGLSLAPGWPWSWLQPWLLFVGAGLHLWHSHKCTCLWVSPVVTVKLLSCAWQFCDPTDWSLPGSSVHGISKARVMEWVVISFSREFSQHSDQAQVSCISRQVLYHRATREAEFHLTLPSSSWHSDYFLLQHRLLVALDSILPFALERRRWTERKREYGKDKRKEEERDRVGDREGAVGLKQILCFAKEINPRRR